MSDDPDGGAVAGCSQPDALDRLRHELWLGSELGEVLAHQLASPLQVDLSRLGRHVLNRVDLLAKATDPPIATFTDLMLHAKPPLELLELVVQFADAAIRDTRGGLPPEIARVLRNASYAVAMGRYGRHLGLTDESRLNEEWAWTQEQGWVDPAIRQLAHEAQAVLAAGVAIPDDRHRSASTLPQVPGYQIIGKLGEGGMGTVWRAVQLQTRREVALKLLHSVAFGSPKSRSRFGREVELAARLEHPHIARVYDSGIEGVLQYLAMELIEGQHLDDYVAHRRCTPRETLRLMQQVCLAVQYAHQRGVIHRDLKPNNILVTPDGQTHVVDFGLAKAVAEGVESLTITIDGQNAGTPMFMSPEQAAGRVEQIDTRTDVYSLGATLYLLLVGQSPHDMNGPSHLMLKRIVEGEVRRPRPFNREIDGELEAILLKALARDPEQRYVSAGELAQDIGHYLRGEPVVARPLTAVYLLRKYVCLYRLPIALAMAVLLLMTAVAAYAYLRVDQARADAVRSAEESHRQRMVAEARLGDALVSEGDAMGAAQRWLDAVDRYHEALITYAQAGASTKRAELGLVEGYRHARPPLIQLVGHEGEVRCVALSPNGRMAATGGEDGTVRIWDVRTGQILSVLGRHGRDVMDVAFSSDGRQVLSASKDRLLRLWDVESGRVVREFAGHDDEVWSADLSADGRMAVSGSRDRTVRLWDTQTGRLIRIVTEHGVAVPHVAFSPDGQTILAGAASFSLLLHETSTGRRLWDMGNDAPGGVCSIAFSANGRRFAVGSADHRVRVYRVDNGQLVREMPPHDGPVNGIALSEGGDWVYSAGGDEMARVLNVDSGERIAQVWGRGLDMDVAWAADRQWAITGGKDGIARVWDLSPETEVSVWSAHAGPVVCVALTRDGLLAASGHQGGKAILWDVATGRMLHVIGGRPGQANAVAFSPNGDRLALGGDDKSIRLFDVGRGQFLCALGEHSDPVEFLVFSPLGDRILSGNGLRLMLWDAQGQGLVGKYEATRVLARSAAFSADGRYVLGASEHGWGLVWDMQTGQPLTPLEPETSWGHVAGTVGLLSDGRVAFCETTLLDGFGLWDMYSGRLLHRLKGGHRSFIEKATVSADDAWGLSCSQDGTVKLWDLKAYQEIRTFVGHEGRARAVAFSGNAQLILSGGDDGTCRLWDLARPARYGVLDPSLSAARQMLGSNPNDPRWLAFLGEWYAFCGRWDWGAELLERSRAQGGEVSALTLARCYWQTGRRAQAMIELARASNQAPATYLQACMAAVQREAEGLRPGVR